MLYSFRLVTSWLHPQIHKAVSHTILSEEAEIDTPIHKSELPPLECPDHIWPNYLRVGFTYIASIPLSYVKIINHKISIITHQEILKMPCCFTIHILHLYSRALATLASLDMCVPSTCICLRMIALRTHVWSVSFQ